MNVHNIFMLNLIVFFKCNKKSRQIDKSYTIDFITGMLDRFNKMNSYKGVQYDDYEMK